MKILNEYSLEDFQDLLDKICFHVEENHGENPEFINEIKLFNEGIDTAWRALNKIKHNLEDIKKDLEGNI